MSAKDISQALTNVNEKYITEALEYKADAPSHRRFALTAACLCVVLLAVAYGIGASIRSARSGSDGVDLTEHAPLPDGIDPVTETIPDISPPDGDIDPIGDNEYDGLPVDGCPPVVSPPLTQEEAYERMGVYLPAEPPEGFTFDSAYDYGGSVCVEWTGQGSDALRWTVSELTQADSARLVSAVDTAKYDLSLYPIPRAETVPAELLETVLDPVFRSSELSPEVIARRVDSYDEPGDEGVRLCFGVLYENNALVHISSKGVDAGWLYEKLMKMK